MKITKRQLKRIIREYGPAGAEEYNTVAAADKRFKKKQEALQLLQTAHFNLSDFVYGMEGGGDRSDEVKDLKAQIELIVDAIHLLGGNI